MSSPLVYLSPRAQADAGHLLGLQVVAEQAVAGAISQGNVIHGKQKLVLLENGVVAVCRREPGRLRPRPRAWRVIELEQRSERG